MLKNFPLDVLLLLVLVPAHMKAGSISFLLVIPLLLYLIIALRYPITVEGIPYNYLPRRARLSFLGRWGLLLIMIFGAVMMPTLTNVIERFATPVDEIGFSPAFADMHDGAIQVEWALDYLSQGQNPYVERYEDSPLRFFDLSGVDLPSQPPFDYFVYLPGYLAISYPMHQLLSPLGLFDQRLVYLLAYCLLVLLLPSLVDNPKDKLTILIAVALNPLLVGPVIIGMNDVAVLLALVAMAYFMRWDRWVLGMICLGLACSLKQSAWFVVPFVLLYGWLVTPSEQRVRRIGMIVGTVGVVMLALIGPFAVWDFSALVTDVLAYPAGAVPVNFPIRGYTIGVLLVGAGIISDPLASFPFGILQLIVGVPLLGILARYQWSRPHLGTLFLCAGLLTFGLGVVSRFFQDNYVGYAAVLISLGLLWQSVAEASKT